MTDKYKENELKEKLIKADCLPYNYAHKDLIDLFIMHGHCPRKNPYTKYEGETPRKLEQAFNITAEHLGTWIDSKLHRAMK